MIDPWMSHNGYDDSPTACAVKLAWESTIAGGVRSQDALNLSQSL